MKNCRDCLDYVRNIDREEFAQYAGYAKDRAGATIEYLVEKAHGFNILDFAILKICLLSLGLWLGAQCSRFFGKFKTFLFASFIASWIFLLWRIFLSDND